MDEGSALRRGLYLHNTQETESMPLTGLEPAVPGSERPQTDALSRVATGSGVT